MSLNYLIGCKYISIFRENQKYFNLSKIHDISGSQNKSKKRTKRSRGRSSSYSSVESYSSDELSECQMETLVRTFKSHLAPQPQALSRTPYPSFPERVPSTSSAYPPLLSTTSNPLSGEYLVNYELTPPSKLGLTISDSVRKKIKADSYVFMHVVRGNFS